ncbi:response regulator transcription factor [Clostridioides difficile]|uniref:response regulator transcription factor n=1 Tax=Clostridioides difficile TaxID=1496 RepID=UPI0010337FA4|nr:response regulator transcription factor [Clostridioides difficile]
MYRSLLVEDDIDLSKEIALALEKWGFKVELIDDFEVVLDEFIDKKYAIKLLDTHLKGHRDNSRKIWTIFTFCLWHQLFIEHKNVEY